MSARVVSVNGWRYEVFSDRQMRNFGLLGDFLRVVIVRHADFRMPPSTPHCHRCVVTDEWFRLGDRKVRDSRVVSEFVPGHK